MKFDLKNGRDYIENYITFINIKNVFNLKN